MDKEPLELIRLLLARLERISVDSYWAHRASGVRGSLLKALEEVETQQLPNHKALESLCQVGFRILERAAREKH